MSPDTIPSSRVASSTPSLGPGRLLGAGLAVAFVLHVALRAALSHSVERDEAEQLLWTQALAWGYGTQPPLYTWLQWLVFQALGVSVLSLALLKNGLLAGTYAFAWLAARRLLAPAAAALAAASMVLLPQIGWESHRDLTHSVLLTTASAATLWLMLELRHAPRTGLYIALGVALAAGALAKYSFVLLPAALALAALPDPAARRALLDRRLALTLAVAALLVAPHALWMLQHREAAVGETAAKLQIEAGLATGRIVRGLGSLALAAVAFLTPWWLVMAALFGRGLGARAAGRNAAAHALFMRYLALIAAMLAALVVLGGAAHFKDRWLQPYLFFAPLIAFVAFPQLAAHPRLRWLGRAIVAVALAVPLVLAARAPFDGWRGRANQLNVPVDAIADAVRAQGVEPALVASADKHLAGALRLVFPGARAVHVDAGAGAVALPPSPGPVLLIAPTERFAELQAAVPAAAGTPPAQLALPVLYGESRPQHVRFAYVVLR